MSKHAQRPGFSLVEVMLALVILTVVAVSVLKYTRQPGERVKQQACDLQIGQLQVLVEQYRADYRRLPSRDMQELSAHRYLGETLPVCPVDGRAFELNLANGQIVAHGSH
ncbi:MAG: prepilin-type N-terminal cleavage/methylation domain-containing protein [Pirellulaceae bacterium]